MPQRFNNKVFLVGIPPSAKKWELNYFLSELFNGRNSFHLALKRNKHNKKNSGCATLFLKEKTHYEQILSTEKLFFQDRHIIAKKFMKKNELKKSREDLKKRKVFVKGLPNSVTSLELFEFFERFGELEDAYIAGENSPNSSLFYSTSFNYGFLVFLQAEKATELIQRETINYNGFKLAVFPYRTKEEKILEESRGNGQTSREESDESYGSHSQLARAHYNQESMQSRGNLFNSRIENLDYDNLRNWNRNYGENEGFNHYERSENFLVERGMNTMFGVYNEQGFPHRNNIEFQAPFSRSEIEEVEFQEEPSITQPRNHFEVTLELPRLEEGEEERYIPEIDFDVSDVDILRDITRRKYWIDRNHLSWNVRLNKQFRSGKRGFF